MGIILETETFNKFGYYPNTLKPNSCKLVIWQCASCKLQKDKKYLYAVKFTNCLACSNKIIANQNLEVKSKRVKEWHKNNEHPLKGTKRPQHVKDALLKANTGRIRSIEEREAASSRMKGVNIGRKASEETRKKMSAIQSKIVRKGKDSNFYGKCYHGKGVWYLDKNNNRIWLRSSWEEKFAIYLDSNNINWVHEPKVFPIVYGDNKEGTYTPDFYLIDSNLYIEIKGWWRDDALEKYEAFVNQYPDLIIEVYDKNKLKELGIL